MRLIFYFIPIVFLCFSGAGIYHLYNKASNQDSKVYGQNSFADVEFALASKYQLLTAGEEVLKSYVEVLSTCNKAYKEANPEGKTLSKDQVKDVIPETIEYAKVKLNNAQDSLIVALKGLKNNPYVGHLAKDVLKLAEKKEAIWDKIGELYIEMMSDIKIAKTLGIDTYQYESGMQTFAMYWLKFEILNGSAK